MMRLVLAVLVAAGLGLPSATAFADGIIVPEPPFCGPERCPGPFPMSQLAIRYHRVSVHIEDQVAVTRVDQVFRNDNDFVVEGTYIFPLPPGAVVTSFTLWIDGRPVEGKVLSREQARQTYEDIVRSLRDPALLEYVDRGAVQASIFPIDPGAERRIELEYTQVLQADQGLLHYRYPLNTEKFSTQPLEEVTLRVEVESRDPIQAAYSPTHDIDLMRDDAHHLVATYEASNVLPDHDFELFYSVGEDRLGLQLLSARDPGDGGDGFFLLLASPAFEANLEPVAKDVLLVIDRSGSMDGEKMEQARQAAIYVLEHLDPGDRFNLISFSSATEAYASGLRPAVEAPQAVAWVEQLAARGSTDINRALMEAVGQLDRERPGIVLFLTDGLPTEGITNREGILENLQDAAPASLRLFSFGVGYDVDAILLDSLSESHHGATTYVLEDQEIDEIVSGFYAKVSTPVLTDLRLDLDDARAYDLVPETLPDLFAGGQLIVVGRYRNPGEITARLSGEVAGRSETFAFPRLRLRESGGPDFLPRLWATRKIGALLSDVRLHGADAETIDQIVRLSIEYGIVTPYTSYLVTEPKALGAEAIGQIAADALETWRSQPTQASGQAAVERSAAESALGGANIAPAPSGEAAEVVRLAGGRTFRLVDGVWTDTGFDPQAMRTLDVAFLSPDYFALAAWRPDLGAALALGERVTVVVDGTAYRIIGSGERGDALQLPAPEIEEEVAPTGMQAEPEPAAARPARGAGLCGLGLMPLAALLLPAGRRCLQPTTSSSGERTGFTHLHR
jgi:Ca-activated chloride channel family protein